jgi:hypothetical protein
LFELTTRAGGAGGALSAAKAAPIMAIKAMKMKRILKFEELFLGFENVKRETAEGWA